MAQGITQSTTEMWVSFSKGALAELAHASERLLYQLGDRSGASGEM